MNCKWKHRSSCCNCGLFGLFFTCEQNNCAKTEKKNSGKNTDNEDENKFERKYNSGLKGEEKGKLEAAIEQNTGGITRQYYEKYLNRAMYVQ